MAIDVSPTLVRYQGRNIYQMLSQGLLSALPFNRSGDVQTPTDWMHETLPPVTDDLAARYAQWSGAPADRYDGVIPAHMVSHWGMSVLTKLTTKAPYNLLSVLNQGCRIQTHNLMPTGEAIQVAGRLADIRNDGRRIRITVQLEAGTTSTPQAQSIEVMLTVPVKGGAKKKPDDKREEPTFETIGEWSAGAYDGVNFALLTGDFNPIHTLWPLAKRTSHRGCILHGFGFLARSYETVRNHGIDIGDFDVRFVKPLRLPAENVVVEISRDGIAEGQHALRLCSPDGSVHLAGQFSEPGETA